MVEGSGEWFERNVGDWRLGSCFSGSRYGETYVLGTIKSFTLSVLHIGQIFSLHYSSPVQLHEFESLREEVTLAILLYQKHCCSRRSYIITKKGYLAAIEKQITEPQRT